MILILPWFQKQITSYMHFLLYFIDIFIIPHNCSPMVSEIRPTSQLRKLRLRDIRILPKAIKLTDDKTN